MSKMIKVLSTDNQYFKAGDHTILKEVFHPKNVGKEFPYSVAHAYLEEKGQSLPHKLQQSELYYFLKGSGVIFVNDENQEVEKGDCVLVEPNQTQFVKNTGQGHLEFICIVSPAWTEDGEQILSTMK